jgi:protein O-GlcNAc transferase
MNDLAGTLAQMGDLATAIDCYRQVLELQPDDVTVRFNLALVLEQSGDIDAAIECYERVLKLAPAHAAASGRLSQLRS